MKLTIVNTGDYLYLIFHLNDIFVTLTGYSLIKENAY
jgi:hypothetical protein